MFGFFKKKQEKEEEKTFDFKLSDLNNNVIDCSNCGKEFGLDKMEPLMISKCPNCENPYFIPLKIKDYWLIQPLGGGGMGSVYKAMHYRSEKIVIAIKVLPRNAKTDQRLIHALLNEATIGKSFGKHPHLISMIDYGLYNDEYFSAMEFVEGKRLDQIIDEKEPVSQKFILLWGLQILSAEQRIYDNGYLFRDIKPQNIIIDKQGNAKLFDYGLCLSLNMAKKGNASEMIEGSPLFMPPERIIGDPEDMNSEIYSVGMILFNIFTGKTYYGSTDAYNLAKKHVQSLRVANVASRMPSNVKPDVSRIIDGMIARSPQDRYQSYKEAATDLNGVYKSL